MRHSSGLMLAAWVLVSLLMAGSDVASAAEPKGLGALQMALRQLQQRLAAEGLFAPERKRPLPRFPARIGFVTSPTGAAVRDFVEVLRGRWQGAHVTVIPVRVQGDGAAEGIIEALEVLNDEDGVDEVNLAFEGNNGLAKRGNVTLVMRLIEGEFPNYQQVIPDSL